MANIIKKQALLPLTILILLAAPIVLPSLVSQLSYAVERGQSLAAYDSLKANQNLHSANALSASFKDVTKAMRPSVVSISSIKHTAANRGPKIQRFRGNQLPRGMEPFFGDDFFDRFFEMPSPLMRPQAFEQGQGTGVIVRDDGYIVTNHHVISGADEVEVKLSDNREFIAKVVGSDKATDVAVLKIEADNLKAAPWGDSRNLEVGDWVLAIGSPFGLEQTVTAGIVSAKGRANVGITDYEDFIQTDAAINPGNSGGPLVSLHGEIVGINTAIASRSGGNMGIGFAIPSAMASSVMNKLIEHGQVERGFIGAGIQDLTSDLAQSFGYTGTQGVLINDLVDDGPAERAGLKPGDIVLELDGQTMKSSSQLRNTVASKAAGSTASIKVFRDGQEQVVDVEIGQLEASAMLTKHEGTANKGLGISVKTLVPELANQIGLDDSLSGVVVTDVQPGSPAASAGIRKRDLITSINGTEVEDARAFKAALDEADLSKGIRMQVNSNGLRRFVFMRHN